MNARLQLKVTSTWQHHAALLDAQPSNRRLLAAARTPRGLRDAGLSEKGELRFSATLERQERYLWWLLLAIPAAVYELLIQSGVV